MTIHEYHFEQVHSQTPTNIGLSIADVDLTGAVFFRYKAGVGMCTYSVYLIGSMMSLNRLKGRGEFYVAITG
jgi:hypothetical protein